MLRMIIVDDEKIIRETICKIVDWDAMGIQIIGLCKNGLEAYDMILDEYPDIVLTDIKMPGLSGLELIKRITQAGKETEFIILSGYGDYEYTKEAMKYGIKYYLLKPCNVAEITEVVQEAKKHCYHRHAREDQTHQDFLLLKKLHESVVFNLVTESISDEPIFDRLQKQYERFLSFTNVSYEVCKLQPVPPERQREIVDAFYAYHNQQAPGIPVYILHADSLLYITFEAYDYDYTQLDKAMCALGLTYTRTSFASLNALLPSLSNVLHHHRTLYLIMETQTVKLWNRKSLYQIAENFVAELRTSTPENYTTSLRLLESKLQLIEDADSLLAIASNIFLNLPTNILEHRAGIGIANFIAELSSCNGLPLLRSKIMEKLQTLSPCNAENHKNGFADKIVAYVYEHLADPELSLKMLSENYLYMNVDYVSKKFLRCMGCKFSSFLAQTRIQKAIQMLTENPALNISAIADAVGCGNNPQYFSQLFKKNTGFTPTEYSNKIGGKHDEY